MRANDPWTNRPPLKGEIRNISLILIKLLILEPKSVEQMQNDKFPRISHLVCTGTVLMMSSFYGYLVVSCALVPTEEHSTISVKNAEVVIFRSFSFGLNQSIAFEIDILCLFS